MTPDIDSSLPYSENTRACSTGGIILHFVVAGVLAILSYFGFAPWWAGLVPPAALFLRSYVYILLTNAFHEALCKAEADAHVAAAQQAQADAQDRADRKSMLTAGFFGEKFFPQVPN